MSGYLGASPVPQTIQKKESFTASAGQTTFNTTGYTDGNFINVFLNGVRLVNGTDYTATNGSDIVLGSAAAASDVLDFETFNEFQLTDQEFANSVIIENNTSEDSDGGRAGKLVYKGKQSGGEQSTLAEIQASHDGTSDDQKGDLIFKTNDGSDNNAPTEAARIDSSQNFLISKTTTAIGTVGHAFMATGQVNHARDGAAPLFLSRHTNEGDILDFYKDSASVGTIGVENDDLNIDGLSGHSGIRFQASSIIPRYNGADANGNMDLGYDDGTDQHRWRNLYLSGGVIFDRVAGNATSNTLGDYEEGTWSPVLVGAGGGTKAGVGSYVKIGRTQLVTCTFNSIGTGLSGNLTITGIPFTINPSNSSTLDQYVPLQFFNLNWDNSAMAVYGYVADNGATIVPYYSLDNANSTIVQGSHLVTDTYLRFTQVFETA